MLPTKPLACARRVWVIRRFKFSVYLLYRYKSTNTDAGGLTFQSPATQQRRFHSRASFFLLPPRLRSQAGTKVQILTLNKSTNTDANSCSRLACAHKRVQILTRTCGVKHTGLGLADGRGKHAVENRGQLRDHSRRPH